MAGILDFLTTALLPQRAIKPVQDAIDDPNAEERSPVAAFGAGALEGLRGMTSPVDLAGLLISGPVMGGIRSVGRAAGVAPEALQALRQASRPAQAAVRDVYGIPAAAARRGTALQTPLEGAGNARAGTGWAEFDLPEESFSGYQKAFGDATRYNGPERRRVPR
jgi:hypothetical protein